MTTFPKYERYKDSGVDSFGEIPDGWDVQPICAVSKPKSIRNCPERELLSVYLDRGVIKFSDVDEKRTNATSTDLSNYQAVDPGDFVLNNQQAWRGSVGVSTHEGIVSPAYIILSLSERWNPAYANYLFRDSAMVSQYLIYSKGVGTIQRNLYYPDFKRASVILPPKPEQDRIVAFLDRKTAEIDDLIAKKQRQIELLDEQKAILIHRAVTRGLNPNAKLKPSGIEWIGEIPEHWEVKKFRHCAQVRGGQVDPRNEPYRSTILIAPDHVESGTGRILGLYSAKDQGAESGKYLVHAGDLIYSKIRPNLRKACIAPVKCLCSADMYAITTAESLLPRFLLGYMLSEGFTKAAVDAAMRVAMPKVNREALADFPVVLPPERDQAEIITWLENMESNRIRTLGSIESQIQSLQALRSTLIAHAVTGRIKV